AGAVGSENLRIHLIVQTNGKDLRIAKGRVYRGRRRNRPRFQLFHSQNGCLPSFGRRPLSWCAAQKSLQKAFHANTSSLGIQDFRITDKRRRSLPCPTNPNGTRLLTCAPACPHCRTNRQTLFGMKSRRR